MNRWVALLLSLLVLTSPAQLLAHEWSGVELSPVWFNLGRSSGSHESPGIASVGAAGSVRFLRWRWTRMYWTTLQAGVGVSLLGTDTVLAHLTTEPGVYLNLSGGRRLELGLAAGAGVVALKYADGCEGPCLVGGGPPLVSPVVRLSLRESPAMPSIFARALVPLSRPDNELFGYYFGFGTAVVIGLDLSTRPF